MFAQLLLYRRGCILALQGQNPGGLPLSVTAQYLLPASRLPRSLWPSAVENRIASPFPLQCDRLHQINARCPVLQGCQLVPIARVWREREYYELRFINMNLVCRKDERGVRQGSKKVLSGTQSFLPWFPPPAPLVMRDLPPDRWP